MLGRRRRGCGCGCSGRGGCGGAQGNYDRVAVYVPAPDPVGSRTALRLDALGGLALRPGGGGPPGYGPTGDVTRTYYGELGPRQGFIGLAFNHPARGAFAAGMDSALPATKVPSKSLQAASPWTARAQFGMARS